MANKALFNSFAGKLAPRANAVNEAGGAAYEMSPEQQLAQYSATGCLNATFYASAQMQLDTVLALTGEVAPEFIARTALYARSKGRMKDMPALLVAALSVHSPGLMAEVFDRVIDSPKMLRNFVQIMRSGVVARKSLGTLPKRLVIDWLDNRSDEAIFFASVGNSPSIVDIIKMVHPKPQTKSREALYGYLLGREHDESLLPDVVKHYEQYKAGLTKEIPDVPFQMLTGIELDTKAWKQIALNGSWQMVRMNLNTFARHGVFADRALVAQVASKLRDPKRIQAARAMPYQLLNAYSAASSTLPKKITDALQNAMEIAIENVPEIKGETYVFVDVSGSMHSPVTGYRRGSTTSVRCVDVAALIAASILRRNPEATVVPFKENVVNMRINPRDSVMTNAQKLASLPAGGTNCSAPLIELNKQQGHADTIIYVSDNESWIDTNPASWRRGTETMREWQTLKARCPKAKLVCIDLQPYGSTQAPDQEDIMNIGGFSDAVFDVVNRFVTSDGDPDHWVNVIEQVSI